MFTDRSSSRPAWTAHWTTCISSWTSAFQSLSEALWISSVSDRIQVAKGIYHESIYLENHVTLYGGYTGTEAVQEQRDWAANPTILDATGLGSRVITVHDFEGTAVDGFTITGGSAGRGGGGLYYSSVDSATLSNCALSANSAHYYGGGMYCSDSSPTLINCTVSGNSAEGYGGGVCCEGSSSPGLTDCTITVIIAWK